MRCCKCHQDSIIIESDEIETIIKCDICGIEYEYDGRDNLLLVETILYNYRLEEAEKKGRADYINNKRLEDNPYPVANNEIMKNKRWEEGYKIEEVIYEREAFSSSLEKLNIHLIKTMNEKIQLERQNRIQEDHYSDIIAHFNRIKDKNYLLGRKYQQLIEEIYSEIDKIKNPDS